jgi:hypothetical protein
VSSDTQRVAAVVQTLASVTSNPSSVTSTWCNGIVSGTSIWTSASPPLT